MDEKQQQVAYLGTQIRQAVAVAVEFGGATHFEVIAQNAQRSPLNGFRVSMTAGEIRSELVAVMQERIELLKLRLADLG